MILNPPIDLDPTHPWHGLVALYVSINGSLRPLMFQNVQTRFFVLIMMGETRGKITVPFLFAHSFILFYFFRWGWFLYTGKDGEKQISHKTLENKTVIYLSGHKKESSLSFWIFTRNLAEMIPLGVWGPFSFLSFFLSLLCACKSKIIYEQQLNMQSKHTRENSHKRFICLAVWLQFFFS